MGKDYPPFRSKEDLEKAINKIRNELSAASITYGLYRYIAEARPKYRRAYYRTRFLWGMAQDALLSQTVLTLCRIYDVGDDRQNSLETLLKRKQKRNSNSTDTENLSADIGLVSESDPMVKKLRLWRVHVLAHTNLGFVTRDEALPPEMVPTHGELLPLIDRAMDILSRHGGSHISRSLAEDLIERHQVDFVFESVAEKMVTAEADIRKFLSERGVNPDVFLDEEKAFEEIQRNFDA